MMRVALGALLALLALGWWIDRTHASARNRAREAVIAARAGAIVRQTDTVRVVDVRYRHDTVRVTAGRREARRAIAAVRADTARPVADSAPSVLATACEQAIAADSVAISTCDRRVADRDYLIALLKAQTVDVQRLAESRNHLRRLTLTTDALYELAPDPGVTAAVGAELRLVGRLSAVADASQRFSAGESPRFLVGGRWTWE